MIFKLKPKSPKVLIICGITSFVYFMTPMIDYLLFSGRIHSAIANFDSYFLKIPFVVFPGLGLIISSDVILYLIPFALFFIMWAILYKLTLYLIAVTSEYINGC